MAAKDVKFNTDARNSMLRAHVFELVFKLDL